MDTTDAPERNDLSRAAAETDAGEGRAGTLTQQAYERLRRDILAGTFPPGSRLRIDALKARYGIGPTPLREALSRLLSDGFVASENHRGFSIPPLSLGELRDITDQRKLVECTALRTAIERGDEEYESHVVAAYYRLSRLDDEQDAGGPAHLEAWERRHREFHRVLIAGARSRWLSRFQELLYDQADRYRRLYLPEAFVPHQVHDDHRIIHEATLERDAASACRLLAEHIERVYEIASSSSYFTNWS